MRSLTQPGAVLLCAFAVILLPAGLAHARSGDIGLSRDGHTWRSALTQALFSPEVRWVPGDVRSAHFFVRNQGPSAAELTVAARVRDRQGLYAARNVRLQVRGPAGAWTTLPTGRVGTRIGHLVRGATTRVRVRVRFVAPAANPTRQRHLSFRLLVRLTQGPHDVATHGDGGLPDTGAPGVGFVAALAVALTTCGAALATRKSRKETP